MFFKHKEYFAPEIWLTSKYKNRSYCQTLILGLELGDDFTFANNNNNTNKKNKNKKNPHLNFLRRKSAMGMKFGTQT